MGAFRVNTTSETKKQENMAQEITQSNSGVLEAGDTTYNWRRGVFFNATVVGLAAFAAPGLWNAMQSVGAGGEQTPYLVMYTPSLNLSWTTSPS